MRELIYIVALLINEISINVNSQASWSGGTVVFVSDIPAGSMTVDFSDGQVVEYELVKRQTYATSMIWEEFLLGYSAPENLTLVTCWKSWRIVAEMKPVTPVSGRHLYYNMVPDPVTCKIPIYFFELHIG